MLAPFLDGEQMGGHGCSLQLAQVELIASHATSHRLSEVAPRMQS